MVKYSFLTDMDPLEVKFDPEVQKKHFWNIESKLI